VACDQRAASAGNTDNPLATQWRDRGPHRPRRQRAQQVLNSCRHSSASKQGRRAGPSAGTGVPPVSVRVRTVSSVRSAAVRLSCCAYSNSRRSVAPKRALAVSDLSSRLLRNSCPERRNGPARSAAAGPAGVAAPQPTAVTEATLGGSSQATLGCPPPTEGDDVVVVVGHAAHQLVAQTLTPPKLCG